MVAREPGDDDDIDERIPLGELVKMLALGWKPESGEPRPQRLSDDDRRVRSPRWRFARLARRVDRIAAELRAEVDYNERLAERQVELGHIPLAKDFRALARDCGQAAVDADHIAAMVRTPGRLDPNAAAVADILAVATVEQRPCKLCGAALRFVGAGPKRIPFDADGQRHERTCPKRKAT
jgi:hypothetical protein